MQKLYAYVDESGQDTEGKFFVVGVVVLAKDRDQIEKELEHIQESSHKRIKKWHKAPRTHRISYFQQITRNPIFHHTLFFKTFSKNKKYIEMTSYATAKAILKTTSDHDYRATIYIDGFRQPELQEFTRGLRNLKIKWRKIRGVKNEESDRFILLADALCGLIRDADDEDKWAVSTLDKLKKAGMVTAL